MAEDAELEAITSRRKATRDHELAERRKLVLAFHKRREVWEPAQLMRLLGVWVVSDAEGRRAAYGVEGRAVRSLPPPSPDVVRDLVYYSNARDQMEELEAHLEAFRARALLTMLAAGMTQREAGVALGLTEGRVWQLVNGWKKP